MSLIQNCSCDNPNSNMGAPNCVTAADYIAKLGLMRLKDNDGSENSLDPTQMNLQAYYDGLINNVDPSKQLLVSPLFDEVVPTLSDDTEITLQNQETRTVAFGVESFELRIVGDRASRQLAAVIDALKCGTFGVFFFDDSNQAEGRDKGDGLLYPLPVAKGSWKCRFIRGEKGNSENTVRLNFNLSATLRDKDFGIVESKFIEPVQLIDLDGLLDVCVTLSNETATSMTTKLELIYGGVNSKKPVEGLGTGDVDLNNDTDGLNIPLLTFDDSATPGTYDTDFANNSGKDVTLTVTASGYDRDSASTTLP